MELPVTFETMREGRGRHKRTQTDVLRTRVWFIAVSLTSGWSAYKLETRFAPDKTKKVDGKIIRPRRWDRYREGKMVPPDRPGTNSFY